MLNVVVAVVAVFWVEDVRHQRNRVSSLFVRLAISGWVIRGHEKLLHLLLLEIVVIFIVSAVDVLVYGIRRKRWLGIHSALRLDEELRT